MSRWVCTVIVLLLVSLATPATAQDAAEDSAQAPAAADTSRSEPAPWYSLLLDNRSDRFAALRLERTELMRKLTGLEGEVKDLRDKNAVLDDQIARLRTAGEGAKFTTSRGVATIGIQGEIDRQKLDKQQAEERMQIELAARVAEEQAFVPAIGAPPDEVAKARAAIKAGIATLELSIRQENARRTLEIEGLERQKKAFEDEDKRGQESEKAVEDQRLAQLAEAQKTLDENGKAIIAKRLEIAGLYARLDVIDTEVLKLIDVGDTDGWFKIIISLSFALLVAGVIYGFYRVIGNRGSIIDEIFSNDSGIQFITIFSIIIAVILFGIIGVLEGKELSALLGGLSGYILGRNSAQPRSVKITELPPEAPPIGQGPPPEAARA